MSRRPAISALRNYLRPTVLRENTLAISCGIWILLIAARFTTIHHFVQMHGLAAIFQHGFSGFVMAWWMLALFGPSFVVRHYWRQVTTEISMAVPNLIAAEYGAILVVLCCVEIALAMPLIALGGPIIGCLAIATLPMIGGMSAPRATGQSRRIRAIVMLLRFPFAFIFMIPRVIGMLLFAPQWITLPLLLTTLGVAGTKLRYFSAHAQLQIDSADLQLEKRAEQSSNAPRHGVLALVLRLIRWKPRRWHDDPLPQTLVVPFGPVGWILFCGVVMAFFIGIQVLMRASQEPLGYAVHRSVLMAVTQLPMISVISTGRWLMNRGDWPFLYLAGRNGARHGFSRALFRAHRRHVMQLAVSAGIVILLYLSLLMPMSLAGIADVAVSTISMVFGLSYMVAAPLLWNEIGGRGMHIGLNFLGGFSAAMAFSVGFAAHGLKWWLLPVSLTVAAAAWAVEPTLARRLAQIDWPFETDVTVQ